MLTTQLRQIKSYPTYQLHAYTRSSSSAAEDMFRICILETMKWLRSRLSRFDTLPEQIMLPEPENYDLLSFDMLQSFSLSIGFNISVVFIESREVWSFELTETDMGENPGTDRERPPVNGRTFRTEISFMLHNDCVEIGIRTICSEPSDTTAPCKVFRPAIVKMLAQNPMIGLRNEYEMNGQPLDITTRSEANRLIDAVQDPKFNIPVVIAAEAPYEAEEYHEISAADVKALLSKHLAALTGYGLDDIQLSLYGLRPADELSSVRVDISHLGFETKLANKDHTISEAKPQMPEKPAVSITDEKADRLRTFDYQRLARKSVGYAFICFVKEDCFGIFNNRMDMKLQCGDVIIIDHNTVIERFPYSVSSADFDEFYCRIKEKVLSLPMRNTVDFGNVVFGSDARLLEIKEKKKQNITIEEKCDLLSQENRELKNKIRDLEQKSAAGNQISDELRQYRKLLRESEENAAQLSASLNELEMRYRKISDAFCNSASVIKFYKDKAEAAAEFPTEISAVAEWAEREYGEYIEISSRAKSELKKYSGSLDVSTLCDGIYFLSGYAKFKTGRIDKQLLDLYAEHSGWEVQNCGKEALKIYKSDYTMNIDGRKLLMDQHIKYGIKSQVLIRVYFTWDDEAKKIAIGYMPGHLPTVRNST